MPSVSGLPTSQRHRPSPRVRHSTSIAAAGLPASWLTNAASIPLVTWQDGYWLSAPGCDSAQSAASNARTLGASRVTDNPPQPSPSKNRDATSLKRAWSMASGLATP